MEPDACKRKSGFASAVNKTKQSIFGGRHIYEL